MFEIREAYDLDDKGLDIDEAHCVVRGVKLIGPVSKNGLLFPRESRQKSHAVLEGRPCNWNHGPKKDPEVKLESRFGWFTNIREDVAGDCTRGDLNYYADHPHVKHFLSMARQNPKACGVSVFGEGKPGGVDKQGRKIVAEITNVRSLDLVADPANTFGLRESEDPNAATPAASSSSSSSEADYGAEGCVKAIEEIITGGAGSAREKLTAIEEHIATLKEMEGGSEEGEEGGKKKEKVEESEKAKVRADCIQLCENLEVKNPDETFLALLVHVPTDQRKDIVTKYKRTRRTKAPQSGPTSTTLREAAPPAAEEDFEKKMVRLAQHVG